MSTSANEVMMRWTPLPKEEEEEGEGDARAEDVVDNGE